MSIKAIKGHRCDKVPVRFMIFKDDKNTWFLDVTIISETVYFSVDTPIYYCPYCGKKLTEHDYDK